MTYAGLTTADKGALMDAKQTGMKWVARDWNDGLYAYADKPQRNDDGAWATDGAFYAGMSDNLLIFIQWSDAEPVNIDLALAQIAEMESKQNNLLSEKASEKPCMTWNERINQMTVEEKVLLFDSIISCMDCPAKTEWCNGNGRCNEALTLMLISPYTEGEKE